MADLTDTTSTSDCCSAEAQQTCCEPSDKATCCDTAAADQTCGCVAGQQADPGVLRATVRQRYAAAATHATTAAAEPRRGAVVADADAARFGGGLYGDERADVPESALLASMGCGSPFAVAELREGETVLDLGSGGGIDVLLSARRVGPTGAAYGLDMTDEMLDLARANQAEAGVENVVWLKGHIEAVPLPADSVDVVISNCVINLSTDKPEVLREAARVLKPGGRFAVSDVIADPGMDAATRADLAQYIGCVAGALTRDEYVQQLADAGLTDIEVLDTHRVPARTGADAA